mmetsp:Transcript_26241/g.43487  ORF Transcript_26241/g.43487 Transcript_26241/m.43487 type:complete len:172 (+) Transcript_26241:40-555(+)
MCRSGRVALLVLLTETIYALYEPFQLPLIRRSFTRIQCTEPIGKITQDDVEIAVKKAENLWEQAMKAREEADCLSEQAAREAEAASLVSEQASAQIDAASKFSLSILGNARNAMDASLDAGQKLAAAVEATERADMVEAAAELALRDSELAIEQYLVDFPDALEENEVNEE